MGTAYLDGIPAPQGTAISAWVDGELVSNTVTYNAKEPNRNNSVSDTFKNLIDGGSLNRVWKFVNASLSWEFYDPSSELLAANTLTDVTPGDIVWVNVNSEQSFQSGTLFPGWNLISLD